MSINIICGLTGSGKTYAMTKIGLALLEKASPEVNLYTCGYHVSHDDLQHRIFYVNDLKALTELERGIVLIDEIGIWFSARNWSNLDPRVQYKFQQHRKDGLIIYGTTQWFDSVDRVIRQLTHKYFECKKIFSSAETAEKVWGLIRMTEYMPWQYDKTRRQVLGSEYYFITKKRCESYDTFEKVTPSSKKIGKGKKDKEEKKSTKDFTKKYQKKLLKKRVLEEKQQE
jgi:hypothetical protein